MLERCYPLLHALYSNSSRAKKRRAEDMLDLPCQDRRPPSRSPLISVEELCKRSPGCELVFCTAASSFLKEEKKRKPHVAGVAGDGETLSP